jgi:hypothetical protein
VIFVDTDPARGGEFRSKDLPVDWRDRAAAAVLMGTADQVVDDGLLAEYVAYRRAVASARSRADFIQIYARWPGVAAADQLARTRSWLRWEVEARLLAGQADNRIAARCTLYPGAVCWYEAIYYAVRHRLGDRGWVRRHVGSVTGRCDPAGLLYCCGYYCGPLPLDLCLAVGRGEPFSTGPNRIFDPDLVLARRTAERLIWQLRRAAVPTASLALQQLLNRYEAVARRSAADGGAMPSRAELDLVKGLATSSARARAA